MRMILRLCAAPYVRLIPLLRPNFFRTLGRALSVLISLRTLDGMPLLMTNFLLLFTIGLLPSIRITQPLQVQLSEVHDPKNVASCE